MSYTLDRKVDGIAFCNFGFAVSIIESCDSLMNPAFPSTTIY